jgi:hypothetical protein
VVLAVGVVEAEAVERPELLVEQETLQVNRLLVVMVRLLLLIKVLTVVMELALQVVAVEGQVVLAVLLVPVLLVLAAWVNYQPSLVHLFITLAEAGQDKEILRQLAPAVLVLVVMAVQKLVASQHQVQLIQGLAVAVALKILLLLLLEHLVVQA